LYNVYRKLIPMALAEANAATTPVDRARVLRTNDTPIMREILRYMFDPRYVFDVTIPSYIPSKLPEGHHVATLFTEGRRLYLFGRHSKTPVRRKAEILRQILEIMDPQESQLVEDIILRDMSKYPNLNVEVVNLAFPGLIPVAKPVVSNELTPVPAAC